MSQSIGKDGIENVPNDVQDLREIYRVLKSKGLVISQVPFVVERHLTEEDLLLTAEVNMQETSPTD